MENNCKICRHPLEEHEAKLGCKVPNPEWEGIEDYCRHCEEDWTWQNGGVDEKLA